MKKTLPILLAVMMLAASLLSSCTAKTDVDEEAKIKESFDGAYTAATYFSTHAKDVYTDGSIEIEYDGDYYSTLRYDRFAPCATMEELHEMLDTYFTPEIADSLKAAEAFEGEPLFRESDGVLYRSCDYVSLYPIDEEYIEVVAVKKNGKGTFTVSVKAEYPDFYGGEDATVTYDYTCEATGDGLYKFTGEFPMLADIALDEMFAKHMIMPIA